MILATEDNVFFLYDVSMYRFIAKCKNASFETAMISLEEASLHFLWFYKNMKSRRSLVGYDLSLEDGKFKLELVYEGLAVEFRAPWVGRLGKAIEQYYDFEDALHVSYDDLGSFKEMCNESTL